MNWNRSLLVAVMFTLPVLAGDRLPRPARAESASPSPDDSLRARCAGFLTPDDLKRGTLSPSFLLWDSWTVEEQRACLIWLARQRRELHKQDSIEIEIDGELMAEFDDGVTLFYVPPTSYEAVLSRVRQPASQDSALADSSRPTDAARVVPAPGDSAAIPVEKLPILKGMPRPAYPPEALERGQQALVRLVVLVGKHGTVRSVLVESGPPLFVAAAIRAARQARFEPALSRGKPVAVWVLIPVRFAMRSSQGP